MARQRGGGDAGGTPGGGALVPAGSGRAAARLGPGVLMSGPGISGGAGEQPTVNLFRLLSNEMRGLIRTTQLVQMQFLALNRAMAAGGAAAKRPPGPPGGGPGGGPEGEVAELAHWQQASRALLDMSRSAERAKFVMLDLVHAASPDAFNTLMGSVELLKASLGGTFLPEVVTVSKALQDAARWVRGLDADQKENLKTWGLVAAGLGGFLLLAPQIVAALKLVALSARLASASLMTVAANPLVLLAVALVTATLRMKELHEEALKTGEALKRLSEGKLTQEQIDKGRVTETVRSLASETKESGEKKTPEELKADKARAEKFLERSIAEDQESLRSYRDREKERGLGSKFGLGVSAVTGFGKEATLDQPLKSAQDTLASIARAKALLEEVRGGKKLKADVPGAPSGFGAMAAFGKAGGAAPDDGLKLALRGAQPSYSAIDEIRKQFQLKVLEPNQLDQEILKIQAQNRDELIKQTALQQQIADGARKGGLGP